MDINTYITSLIQYALNRGLIEPCDRNYAINQLLQCLKIDTYEEAEPSVIALEDILKGLIDDAVARGVCSDDVTSRDLLDTMLMGALTPRPHEVRKHFEELLSQDPQAATDWFYKFSQDTDYIRRYRIQKDMHWLAATEYGTLDMTINLSKPEKDPKAIAQCHLVNPPTSYAGRRIA